MLKSAPGLNTGRIDRQSTFETVTLLRRVVDDGAQPEPGLLAVGICSQGRQQEQSRLIALSGTERHNSLIQ